MTMELSAPRIAILIANGFEESHITAVQRTLTAESLAYHIVAPEQGLVNGWQNNAWGHYFTVDQSISTAMGSDYDCLLLAGGERGTEKLKNNPHTRRIVNHFLEAGKPIAAIETGVALLALSPKSAGLEIACCEGVRETVAGAQMTCAEEEIAADRSILTSNGADVEAWAQKVVESFSAYLQQEAEQAEQAAAEQAA